MGIRGTVVLVEITADNGPTKFAVLPEPDGTVGSFTLYLYTTAPDGTITLGAAVATVSKVGEAFSLSGNASNPIVQAMTMSPAEVQAAMAAVAKAVEAQARARKASNPRLPRRRKRGDNTQSGGGGSSTSITVTLDCRPAAATRPPAIPPPHRGAERDRSRRRDF